ncbi:DUF58 domain-containing protein [Alkalihalophilus marmarensis]|uniref:DUF58 domain-containing protein n=1 Tax=Alkalihalophilus marmarensis TaxID=521377 RepID=UPI002DBA5447|nr:DUF58 domain-containing protein [Alkalihalophilus marmarensis]MEC2071016.1 DUF58 domain-containing protein [Alkalihalophilus marmarensis]
MIERMFRALGTITKLIILLLIVAGTYAYAMFQGGFVSWFLFYSVVTLIGLTVLVGLFNLKGFKVERKLSSTVLYSGDSIEVEVILKKSRFQPFFYVRVRDIVPNNIGSQTSYSALFFFSFSNELRFTYKIKGVKRGEHTLTKTELSFGDLFGLFEKKFKVEFESTFIVYPAFKVLNSLPRTDHSQIEEGTRPDQSLEEERSLAGVRSYTPGDRLTSINWKQSARVSQLMTKEFETFRNDGAVVLFEPYMRQPSSEPFEKTVELSASLIATVVKGTNASFSIRSVNWQSYEMTQANLPLALKLLAKVEPEKTGPPPIHKIYREWRGKNVYVVSAELNAELIAALTVMKEQKISPHVVLYTEDLRDQVMTQKFKQKGIKVHVLPIGGVKR